MLDNADAQIAAAVRYQEGLVSIARKCLTKQ